MLIHALLQNSRLGFGNPCARRLEEVGCRISGMHHLRMKLGSDTTGLDSALGVGVRGRY